MDRTLTTPDRAFQQRLDENTRRNEAIRRRVTWPGVIQSNQTDFSPPQSMVVQDWDVGGFPNPTTDCFTFASLTLDAGRWVLVGEFQFSFAYGDASGAQAGIFIYSPGLLEATDLARYSSGDPLTVFHPQFFQIAATVVSPTQFTVTTLGYAGADFTPGPGLTDPTALALGGYLIAYPG